MEASRWEADLSAGLLPVAPGRLGGEFLVLMCPVVGASLCAELFGMLGVVLASSRTDRLRVRVILLADLRVLLLLVPVPPALRTPTALLREFLGILLASRLPVLALILQLLVAVLRVPLPLVGTSRFSLALLDVLQCLAGVHDLQAHILLATSDFLFVSHDRP